MSALAAARERLEAFCKALAIPGRPDPDRDAMMVTRMIDEVERCARIAAVEQWTSGRPF